MCRLAFGFAFVRYLAVALLVVSGCQKNSDLKIKTRIVRYHERASILDLVSDEKETVMLVSLSLSGKGVSLSEERNSFSVFTPGGRLLNLRANAVVVCYFAESEQHQVILNENDLPAEITPAWVADAIKGDGG
jgi:hypothetical protein